MLQERRAHLKGTEESLEKAHKNIGKVELERDELRSAKHALETELRSANAANGEQKEMLHRAEDVHNHL